MCAVGSKEVPNTDFNLSLKVVPGAVSSCLKMLLISSFFDEYKTQK